MANNDISLNYIHISESWFRLKDIFRHSFERTIPQMSLHFLLISISYLRHFKGSIFEHNWQFSEDFKWVNADEEFSMCMNIINWIMRFHWSWLDVGCLDDILLVAILDNLQQISEELEHRRKQLKNCYALLFVGWASTRISFIPEASHSCKFRTHFKWLNTREEVFMKGFSYHSSACPV